MHCSNARNQRLLHCGCKVTGPDVSLALPSIQGLHRLQVIAVNQYCLALLPLKGKSGPENHA
eukprot:1137271-Pleurochrysis_carterae.AAC.2